MTPNEYQEMAHDFASYWNNPLYPVMGLAEEAGEVAGKVAKFLRKHGREPLTTEDCDKPFFSMKPEDSAIEEQFRNDLTKELGDVLWMVAEIATNYGLNLEVIMTENISKLTDRRSRGVIVGEGDNR